MTIKNLNQKEAIRAKQDKQAKSEKYAKASLSSADMSAVLSDSFTTNIFPDLAIADVADALRDKITEIQNGDMKSIEAMLISHAQALQTIFVSLGRKAAAQSQLGHYTAIMNLALKAQNQSRSTIQTFLELKFPKQATFVKQANIANGLQQINNNPDNNERGINAPEHARVKEIENQSNELLTDMDKTRVKLG
jgi:hypothetical protein